MSSYPVYYFIHGTKSTTRSFEQTLFSCDMMLSSATCLHGRSQEMSALHYMTAFILARGGCTQRVELSVYPQTLLNKLASWKDKLNEALRDLKVKWTNGEESTRKFQLVGDNWDKDILPFYRNTDRKTENLHLFLDICHC